MHLQAIAEQEMFQGVLTGLEQDDMIWGFPKQMVPGKGGSYVKEEFLWGARRVPEFSDKLL